MDLVAERARRIRTDLIPRPEAGRVPRVQEAVLAAVIDVPYDIDWWPHVVERLADDEREDQRLGKAWRAFGQTHARWSHEDAFGQWTYATLSFARGDADLFPTAHPRPAGDMPGRRLWIEFSHVRRAWLRGPAVEPVADELVAPFADVVLRMANGLPGSRGFMGRWEDFMVCTPRDMPYVCLMDWGPEARPGSYVHTLSWGGTWRAQDIDRTERLAYEEVQPGRRLAPKAWFRGRAPRPVTSSGPKSNGDLVLVAGVDIDTARTTQGRSLLERFLEGAWGDPGALVLSEARRAFGEFVNGEGTGIGPMCIPLRGGSGFGGLRAFIARDHAVGFLGLPVATQRYDDPTIKELDVSGASGRLRGARALLKRLDVADPPALHMIVVEAGCA